MTAIALTLFALVALCNAATINTEPTPTPTPTPSIEPTPTPTPTPSTELTPEPTPRPINVRRVKPGEISYMVSLQYDLVEVRFCSAVLLSKDYALTTAECLQNMPALQLLIVIGTTDLHDRQTHTTAAQVIYHKDYRPASSFMNNLALLKLKTPMPESDLISYATLPDPEEILDPSAEAELVGWGLIRENDRDQANHLQLLEVVLINQDNCSYIYQPARLTIYGSQVCAFKPPGEKYNCERQGGSALISGGKFVGLLSYQRNCVEGSYPSVYERLTSHLEWIKKNTAPKNSSNRHVPTLWSSYGAMLFITLSSVLILPNNMLKSL